MKIEFILVGYSHFKGDLFRTPTLFFIFLSQALSSFFFFFFALAMVSLKKTKFNFHNLFKMKVKILRDILSK